MGCVLILAAAAGAAAVVLALRLWLVLHSRVVVPRESVSLMAVAGSGGHTTELLRLLGHLSAAYSPRHYVVADTDEISARKIHAFELSRADRDPSGVAALAWEVGRLHAFRKQPGSLRAFLSGCRGSRGFGRLCAVGVMLWRRVTSATSRGHSATKERPLTGAHQPGHQVPRYFLHRIPRSREVRQSWLSTVLTTLHSACLSLPLTYRVRPDLVLCNGPGTCVPICAAAVLLGVLGLKRVTVVYVESLCRVEHLSLTGRILRPFADYFLVQWPALKEKYPTAVYLGRIV